MKIENPSNAFLRVNIDKFTLVCDPWLTDGIYEGGWGIYPPLKSSAEEYFQNVTHVYISHIHEDHFDLTAISKLNRDVKFLIPKVYPYNVMIMKLEKLGFTNITLLEMGLPYEIEEGIHLEVIKPMNSFGQELDNYDQNAEEGLTPTAIDTGIILTHAGSKAVFLSDNSPYHYKHLGETFTRMQDCDVLAFPYNGAASDYPLCYTNISFEESVGISRQREEKRFVATSAFIEVVKPKSLMPYSSDFCVIGPMAREFARYSNEWWFDKKQVCQRYHEKFNLPAFFTREGSFLMLDNSKISYSEKKEPHEELAQVVDRYYSPVPKTKILYQECSPEKLDEYVSYALENMFTTMTRLGLKSDWVLAIELIDFPGHAPYFIDFGSRAKLNSPPPHSIKLLTCSIDSGYLEAILTGKSHWNNAQLSFQLKWKRAPNEYNHDLYTGLNFFHIPRSMWNMKK